jgi:hypothetical protein
MPCIATESVCSSGINMTRFTVILSWIVALALVASAAHAEPAWGSNCLSCHDKLAPAHIYVLGEDTIADPDEAGTGAPDRGILKVFHGPLGGMATIRAELSGLSDEDTYAVEMRRFRFPGVTADGTLAYSGDCAWAQWEDPGDHYSDPSIAFEWPGGPRDFAFEIYPAFEAGFDFYDLVFAVAGKEHNTGNLFYAEEHFYLRVDLVFPQITPGDIDQDGHVDLTDFSSFVQCLGGADEILPPPACHFAAFGFFDLDDDGDVDLHDFSIFAQNFTG